MRLQEARRDYYRKLARESGYKSRAAYKLIEAQKKYGLIRSGGVVLDLGAAPGGWLQVAAEVARLVVGIDLATIALPSDPRLVTIRSDVNSPELPGKLEGLLPANGVDAVLSDLSPQVTGAWDLDHYRQIELTLASLGLADRFIRPGGNSMLKVFDGERFGEIRGECTRRFRTVHVMKPQASRRASSELYLVCLGYLRTASRTST